MMNDKLDWTQQVGDAFLANQEQVMQTVQSLRARAQAAGNLQSNEQQRIIEQDRSIVIEPAQPQFVYVPVYNPLVIYGPWWAPAYRPWYWYPPPVYGYPPLGPAFGVGIVWGTAWAVSYNHWGWARPNWHGGTINVNVNATIDQAADRSAAFDHECVVVLTAGEVLKTNEALQIQFSGVESTNFPCVRRIAAE